MDSRIVDDDNHIQKSQIKNIAQVYHIMSQQFMGDIVKGFLPENRDLLTRIVSGNEFPFPPELTVLPVLIIVPRYAPDIKGFKPSEMDFTAYNVLNELLKDLRKYTLVWHSDDSNYYYIVLFHQNNSIACDCKKTLAQRLEAIDVVCHRAFEFFTTDFGAPSTIYIYPKAIHLWELHTWFKNMLQTDRANTGFRERVLHYGDLNFAAGSPLPKLEIMEGWYDLLANGQSTELLRQIRTSLSQSVMGHCASEEALNLFYHDFMQMLNTVLKDKHVSSGELFSDRHLAALTKYTTHSLVDLIKWLSAVIPMAAESIKKSMAADTPCQQMLNFIHTHYAKSIGRNEIASAAHLSPVYGARIFKGETGISMNSYLNRYRVEKAKALMQNNNITVSEISAKVGFEHLSYFSSTFSAIEGVSPREYRRQLKNLL